MACVYRCKCLDWSLLDFGLACKTSAPVACLDIEAADGGKAASFMDEGLEFDGKGVLDGGGGAKIGYYSPLIFAASVNATGLAVRLASIGSGVGQGIVREDMRRPHISSWSWRFTVQACNNWNSTLIIAKRLGSVLIKIMYANGNDKKGCPFGCLPAGAKSGAHRVGVKWVGSIRVTVGFTHPQDEKRNKMTKESIVELLEEIPLPPPFSARVPALQEPANYGTNLETSVYEGHIRSGYRVPMHPFAVAFFNHYKMAPGQLVPNGWRKLVGLIYLVQTSGYPVTVDDFMRLYLEVCFIKNVTNSVGWYYIHNRIRVIKGGPKSNKGWHSRYFFIQRPSDKWEFSRKWNGFCKDYEKRGSLAPNATTKKLIDHIKRRGVLSTDEPLSDQEMRHAGLLPPAPALPVPPTPVVESQPGLGPKTQGLAIGMSSSRTPSLGLLQKASKGKRKEGTGEGSSPLVKKARAMTPPVPPLVVEDLPIDKDPIFRPRWTIKRGDSGMPSSHVSAQHLAHGVLPSDKLILENQPHEAFAMAHVQAAYNAYCYSSQMQDRFAMDVARTAETDKRAVEGKADKLDKEVKNLKTKNADLLTKLGHLEKRCEKLRHEKAEIGNKAIQAFPDGTAGEEWLRKRIEDGLSIFQEGFQKAKELTMAKYPSLFLDDIVVPTFESPSGKTAAPPEARDAISPGEKIVQSGNVPTSEDHLYVFPCFVIAT
ncbi:hypothetical protein RJ639_028863 [Escallonia herrerae]|uniref:Transposase (putative) gypsy type domain-containing protein n=1 Tax=Escallonia herrerae TaxID=1293975 RepID=A0AA88X398_9ASTE|nr:hypothetical protein RJ639_028863 [Escallonia herrerae]